ncbi:MAG: EamA family transporter [Candidatus Liptonbacteria bacterium]
MMNWVVLGLLSAVSAALVAVFGKIGIEHVDTTLATTVRAVIMVFFLVATSLLLGKAPLLHTIDNKALLYITLSGIAGALSWFFYFFALKLGPASGVAALDRLSVVFVFVLALLFLGEKFTYVSALGALFIAIGAVLMVVK